MLLPYAQPVELILNYSCYNVSIIMIPSTFDKFKNTIYTAQEGEWSGLENDPSGCVTVLYNSVK